MYVRRQSTRLQLSPASYEQCMHVCLHIHRSWPSATRRPKIPSPLRPTITMAYRLSSGKGTKNVWKIFDTCSNALPSNYTFFCDSVVAKRGRHGVSHGRGQDPVRWTGTCMLRDIHGQLRKPAVCLTP